MEQERFGYIWWSPIILFSPGQRVPHGLLLVHHLQPQDGHRRRVLPDGGQEAALQDRLRVGQGWERSATYLRLPPPHGAT